MGLVGEKWLVSESFGETRTKEKNRKGLGSRREKVEGTGVVGNLGGCWRKLLELLELTKQCRERSRS